MTLGHSAIDVSQLRTRIRAPWGSAPGDPEILTAAATATRDLAHRAYVQGDRTARWQAESIIYYLNLESCFAPPAEPVAGLVWSSLMQSKLGALRREFAGDLAAEMSADEMQAE